MKAIDLFAGPGGWDLGLQALGYDALGVEWDDAACATREAAGLRTHQGDVAMMSTQGWRRGLDLLIASPPCQSFSKAGKAPKHDRLLIQEIAGEVYDGRPLLTVRDWQDPRSALVLEPLRWILECKPKYVALEQVKEVLPFWGEVGMILGKLGYSWKARVLNCADYGVPQTRKRAILIASRVSKVAMPEPTHSKAGKTRKPWVSMAEALGWTGDELVRMNLGTRTDDKSSLLRPGTASHHGARERDYVPSSQPARTLTTKGADARIYPKAINTGRDWKKGEGRAGAQKRSTDEPAPTVTTETGSQWQADVADEKDWCYERPSTTIAGRALAPDPGANANKDNGKTKSRNDGVRLTIEQGLLLQTFPADYPVQGTMTKQWEQVGNAVPPLLAEHVLRALLPPGK